MVVLGVSSRKYSSQEDFVEVNEIVNIQTTFLYIAQKTNNSLQRRHTGFLIHLLFAVRALIFLAGRIQPFLSLVDREVEFCVLTI